MAHTMLWGLMRKQPCMCIGRGRRFHLVALKGSWGHPMYTRDTSHTPPLSVVAASTLRHVRESKGHPVYTRDTAHTPPCVVIASTLRYLRESEGHPVYTMDMAHPRFCGEGKI
ncbi:hypothetical protein CHARACLAT_019196 [Characodon lateralis]|uniref:Uncharacterized protein n=1 Tax=Characodon lateralis TaxID=208331 RepID=A0ABU7D8R9_9TELE|nr:hypothetical protein [Characodon lateralis]